MKSQTNWQPNWQSGDMIGGRYQVAQSFTSGKSELYLCLDMEQNLPVALRTLPQSDQKNSERQAAFETDASAWAALPAHPNLVRCLALQQIDDQPFMILEWIQAADGGRADLGSRLQSGPLPVRPSLEYAIDICAALLHVQQEHPGFVHGNLNPRNILIAQEGIAKVVGAGQVRLDGSQEPDGSSMPGYMAPEQWRGDSLDARTDIYAIGCLLYEMLAGHPAFAVEAPSSNGRRPAELLAEWQAQHESAQRPELPSPLLQKGPAALVALVGACLAIDPQERPSDINNLLQSMRLIHHQVTPAATPASSSGAKPAPSGNGNKPPAGHHLNQGLHHAGQGDLQASLASFNQAVEAAPHNAQTYANRGVVYRKLGQFEQAMADFDRAIELDPNLAQAYINRGNTHASLQELDLALADYTQAIELDRDNVLAYFNRGNIHKGLRQASEALADYSRAIELDPSYTNAYYNRAVTYAEEQKPEEALADYSRVIDLDPQNARAYFQRGVIHRNIHQYDEALADLDRAIELDPNNAQVFFTRGNTHRVFRQYEQALADYSQAILLNPNLAEAYANRGNTYSDLEQVEEAMADFNKAIELDEDYAHAYLNLGVLMGNQGNHEEALGYFEKAAALGLMEGKQYADRARQALDPGAVPAEDPVELAFTAFQKAGSEGSMRKAVERFPFMVGEEFISAVVDVINQQVPREQKPAFEQRLAALRKIAAQQSRGSSGR